MKIGIVCRFPPEKDGIGVTYLPLIKEISKLAEIITIGTKLSDADYKIDFTSFSLKKEISKIISKENLELLHFHYIAPFYGKYTFNLNFLAALNQKIPVMATLHEVQYSCRGIKKKILCKIQEKIIHKASLITVHTPSQKKFLEEKYNAHNIECVYMGISPKPIHKKILRNILFFGILSKQKGIEFLIEAMKALPDCRLKIAVSMPHNNVSSYKKLLLQKISTLNIKNAELISKGWYSEEERASYYKWADVVALPYLWGDYQSAVITDAIAYGLPVIVTKVGAIWETVGFFKCGIIVQPENSAALSCAIKEVFARYNEYQKGVFAYRKEADWENIAKIYLGLYEKMLSKVS